jgi:hypothetical protein
MKLKSTKDYDIFKFREDNRSVIDQGHVKRLISSIKAKNLLELRPISVNENMEIIDGQHRLLAAKHLDVEVFYHVENNLKQHDIILMNTSKSWNSNDYLNYYVKNDYPEYIKLKQFMERANIHLKVALGLCFGSNREQMNKFRNGEYVFQEDTSEKQIHQCWETIKYIKRMNGYSAYTASGKFWKAIIKLVQHGYYDHDKWMKNLSQMIERLGPRARTEDYIRMFMEIYNWKSHQKLNLLEG